MGSRKDSVNGPKTGATRTFASSKRPSHDTRCDPKSDADIDEMDRLTPPPKSDDNKAIERLIEQRLHQQL